MESGFSYQIRLLYVHNDGNKLLFDFKSSKLSLGPIFFSARLQLSAHGVK